MLIDQYMMLSVSKWDDPVYTGTERPSLFRSDWARLLHYNVAMGGSLHLLHSESVTFPALKNAGTHLIHLGRVE